MNKRFATKISLILYFLRGAKRYFILSACFAALVSLLDMLSPKVISFTVDCVIGDDAPALPGFAMWLVDRSGGTGGLKEHLLLIALAAALIGAMAALARYCFRALNARGAERFVERMRNELFGHIMYLPYTWLGENSTGDIIQRCTSDVQTIKRFISEQMTALVRTIILIIMAVSFMAGISRQIMLTAFVFIPVIVGYSLFFHTKIGKAFERADIEEGKLSTIAQENLTGVRVVRAFGREAYERERFEKQNREYTGFWVHLFQLMSAYWASGDVLTGTQVLAVILLGTVLCVRGELSAGNFIASVSYTTMLIWPVRTLGRVISEMSKAGISIERLRYIMNAEAEKDAENAGEAPLTGDIRFEHVTFTYPNSTEKVLDDISFEIKAGTTVGILGGTGSGKSTLMYLLERLYELPPENGRITIGGTDIAGLKASYLRKNIGIVLQEPFLFSRTLRENIGFADDSATEEEITDAARIASMDETIRGFKEGYQTTVGERGMTLSGGQKQRTAIAQMLVRRTPVMIFDDSLSAVDTETDRRIRHAIRKKTSEATVLLISHRITSLMNADRIIVLEGGRVREEGTHQELLEMNGLYKKVFDLQVAGTEL